MKDVDLMFAFEKARKRFALIEKFKALIDEMFDLALTIAKDPDDVADIQELRAFAFAVLEGRPPVMPLRDMTNALVRIFELDLGRGRNKMAAPLRAFVEMELRAARAA
jgi:hypothetical protein